MNTNLKDLNLQNVSVLAVSFLSLFAIHPMLSIFGTGDYSDERYFLNISNYSFGSNANTDSQTTNRLIKKTLVYLALENSLLDIGKGTLATVISQLRAMYQYSLLDSFEHPDSLSVVLKLRGDDIYKSCIASMKWKLKELGGDKEIVEFLQKISK